MKDLISYLKRLGLTEYQARIMLVLFCRGEATAKEICELGRMRHTKIYQVLKSLEDKGFVTYNYTKPREYHGLPASKTMRKLIEKHEKNLKQMKDYKRETIDQLKRLDLDSIENLKAHPMWSAEPYKLE